MEIYLYIKMFFGDWKGETKEQENCAKCVCVCVGGLIVLLVVYVLKKNAFYEIKILIFK